jgi:hypothetical protein
VRRFPSSLANRSFVTVDIRLERTPTRRREQRKRHSRTHGGTLRRSVKNFVRGTPAIEEQLIVMRTVSLGAHSHNALLGVASCGEGRCASTVAKDGVVAYDVDREVR